MKSETFQDLHWLLDIIQSADIGIIVIDKNYRIEIYNRFMQVHSGKTAQHVIGSDLFTHFPYLDADWFRRRVNSVFELGIPVHTTWEQRTGVFDYQMALPIHYEKSDMYQNTTFVPLRSANNAVERVGIIVYDVTDTAYNSQQLESAKEELLRLSRTDRLTRLWNRGYWEERQQEEYRRYSRSHEDTALVMFDIDHFKKINDGYGHQVGDEAIRLVSQLLLESSREVDVCGRYGGEEFVVVLPMTDEAGAMTYCERLRKKIAGSVLPAGESTLQFTISLGIAVLTDEIKTPTEWIVCADNALYASKEGGRNLTTVYKPS